jgi:class 3 adenylate cyclase/tetratricopeptide (TPR) repeat protein
VHCPRCQHENLPVARFCEECAYPLDRTCANCGTRLSAIAKFCHTCAHPAVADAGNARRSPESYTPKHLANKILTSKVGLEGERKQVTVLFADLKGSMELLAGRDPEEARKILDPVLEYMMEAVHFYEGTVNQVMGDGIMALFGAPLAHEDHAVRACYAALRMQQSVKKYAEEARRSHAAVVNIRVGLNSGEVVVRTISNDLRMDYSAVGPTTHLAARMEQIASPGAIVITPGTLALVEGYVEVTSLGPVPLKGLTGVMEVYEVTGAGAARTRLQATARRGLTRFVGRNSELEQLRHAEQLAFSGRGQVMAVIGEAGVGKSRLVYEFTHSPRLQSWLTLDSASVSHGKATSYLPVIHLLKGFFKIQDRDDLGEIREKVTAKVLTLDESLKATLPALLALLDVPVDEESWRTLDPAQRRQSTLDAVKRLLLREARRQPLLLVFEDLHWIDTETQAVLDSLVDSLGSSRQLLVVNYRPEYAHAWGGKTYYSQVRLDALPEQTAGDLLDSVLGNNPALAPLKQLLVKDGNPLFLEEAVRSLVETKTLAGEPGRYQLIKSVQAIQVPPTVQAVLAARVDRLPSEDKRLLQIASAIGQHVPAALLQAIVDLPNETLRHSLDHLQAAEFLCETGLFPDIEYSFKHALTLEATYATLLRERRRDLDARIVNAIERLYPDYSATQIERLAHHSFRGEVWDKALIYCQEAGARALDRSALAEALGHVDHALEALTHVGDVPERKRLELVLVTQRATALRALRGYAAPEVERVYLKARELCQDAADVPERFGLEWQQMQFFLVRAELDTAKELASRLLGYAEARRETALLIDAHLACAMAAFPVGDFATARDHLQLGVALCRSESDSPRLVTHGQCPRVFCLGYLGWTQWFLGWPDGAATSVDQAVELARQKDHAFTYVSALIFAARVHYGRREIQRVRTLAGQIIALARDQGFAYYEAQGHIHEGWARVLLEGDEAGYAQLRDGCTALERTGTVLGLRGALVQAVEVCQRLGRSDEALQVLRRIQTATEGSGIRCWDAEIARLNAELASQGSSTEVARHWYRTALKIAHAQGARSLELRAALSYARATRSESDGEAQARLAEVVGTFNDGAETRELREARSLLSV